MSASASPLRLFVPDDLRSGAEIEVSPDQARYILQVMRRSTDDPLLLFNGRDGEWRGALVHTGKKTATVHLNVQTRGQITEPELILLFAPVKRTATDFIVQKATELGVTAVHPVITSRTNGDRIKTDRLTAIAAEAAEQCRRISVPQIFTPVPLREAVANWPAGRVLFVMDETGGGDPIAQIMTDSAAQNADTAAFVIGPEGGFSDTELDLLRALPFCRLISLGPRILRAETAALAAMTCWQALCGDWRHPAVK